MEHANGVVTPMEAGSHLSHIHTGSTKSEEEKSLDDTIPYRSLVGLLQYAANITRPDLMYAVNQLAQHVSKPCIKH